MNFQCPWKSFGLTEMYEQLFKELKAWGFLLQLSPCNDVHQAYNTKHEDNDNAVISSWPIARTDVQ